MVFARPVPHICLRRSLAQHQRVGAVEYGIGNVGHLGAVGADSVSLIAASVWPLSPVFLATTHLRMTMRWMPGIFSSGISIPKGRRGLS